MYVCAHRGPEKGIGSLKLEYRWLWAAGGAGEGVLKGWEVLNFWAISPAPSFGFLIDLVSVSPISLNLASISSSCVWLTRPASSQPVKNTWPAFRGSGPLSRNLLWGSGNGLVGKRVCCRPMKSQGKAVQELLSQTSWKAGLALRKALPPWLCLVSGSTGKAVNSGLQLPIREKIKLERGGSRSFGCLLCGWRWGRLWPCWRKSVFRGGLWE